MGVIIHEKFVNTAWPIQNFLGALRDKDELIRVSGQKVRSQQHLPKKHFSSGGTHRSTFDAEDHPVS